MHESFLGFQRRKGLTLDKKNIALVGYGYWGQKIYSYLKKSEDFQVRHVFFRSLKGLSQDTIKKKYGDCYYKTYQPMWCFG